MNRDEYLDLLRLYLKDLPSGEIQDILLDYEEHFRIGISKGKTEEEISKELGSPKTISDNYIESVDTGLSQGENIDYYNIENNNNITKRIFIGLLLVFFNLIIVLGPFLAIVGVLFSFYIVAISMIFAGGASLFGFPVMLLIPSSQLHFLTTFFFGIGFIALGILGILLCLYLTKLLIKLSVKYFNWNIELINK